jgi:hypothetical protein
VCMFTPPPLRSRATQDWSLDRVNRFTEAVEMVQAEALMEGIEVQIEGGVWIRSVRRVTCGLARLNVIVMAWWRVVVSIHLVSLLVKHRSIEGEDEIGRVIDGII